MNTGDCKGCNLYEICYAIHILKVDSKGCPCVKCLVKMVCIQRCNEYMNFRLQYNSEKQTDCNGCRVYNSCPIVSVKYAELCPCSVCPTEKTCNEVCGISKDYYNQYLISDVVG